MCDGMNMKRDLAPEVWNSISQKQRAAFCPPDFSFLGNPLSKALSSVGNVGFVSLLVVWILIYTKWNFWRGLLHHVYI
jgi:hypothetical protein